MRRREIGLAAVIVLATVLAYVPALQSGFVWDDDFYVTKNQNLRDLDGLVRVWTTTSATPQYYPLTHTTFWIERQLYGLHPFGYHLVNVLLHAGSVVLVGFLLTSLGVPWAWFAAAVFALHPVHVESVAWITERKNVLSGFLYLSSAIVFLDWALEKDAERQRRRRWRAPVALGLFLGALLSKTVTASLPAALGLVIFWKRGRLERRHLPWLGAMLVLGATLGSLTSHLEKHHVGAHGREFALTFADRLLVAGRAFWFYVGKLAWPHPLAFNYARWDVDSGALAQWIFPAAAVGGLATLWILRARIGRGPLVAFAFFALTLVPALGFFDVFPMKYSFVADHFQYLASLGPISLVTAGAACAWYRWGERRIWVAASGAPVLVVLGALTWHQSLAYRNLETLWRRTIAASPGAFMAHYNLGRLLAARGQTDEALAEYREALRANPYLVEGMPNVANILARRGQPAEAIDLYTKAISIEPEGPLPYYNLGISLEAIGRVAEAEHAYRESLRLWPSLADAHVNLAVLLYGQGRYRESWDEVFAARQLGASPRPEFFRALASRMPEPRSPASPRSSP